MVERTLIPIPSQLQLIERLQHLIYLSSSLIFIAGEAGSGKSTLTENLSNALSNDLQQVYISLSKVPTEAKLRQQIVTQLYEKPLFNSEDRLIDTISRLQESERQSKNKLIIIDNASNLPDGFILELCELFSDAVNQQDASFNVLLLANEQTIGQQTDYINDHLISRIQTVLNQVHLTLPVLTSKESVALLQHNFTQVGYTAELQHQDALSRQLKLCNGNPQKIIQLADDLSQGILTPDTNTWIKTRLPSILFMLLLLAIVTLIAFYLYPQFIPNDKEVNQPDSQVIAIEETATPTEDEILVANDEPNHKTEKLAGSWKILDGEILDNKNSVGLSDNTEQRTVLTDDQLVELSVFVNEPEQDEADLSNESQETTSSLTLQQETYEGIPLYANSPLSAATPTIEAENTEVIVNNSSNDGMLKIESEKEVEEAINPPFTASKWLLAKAPESYTIQLSAMASREYLDLFLSQNKNIIDELIIYQTVRKNNPWFVVIYGDYDSINSAQSASKNLPGNLKKMPVWVKKWQTVHNDLRLNDE